MVDLGCFIEYYYLTNLLGKGAGSADFPRMIDKMFVAFVRIAPEHSFISTYLGQLNMPNPIEGMRTCIKALIKAGMAKSQIDLLVRSNPAYLMGLSI